MDWKYYALPTAGIAIIPVIYFAVVAATGNTSPTSAISTYAEVLFALIGFIVVGLGLIYTSKTVFGPGSFQYAGIFAMYLPVTYVMVGIISDIVAQQYKASASSVTAIMAVIVNKLVSMLFIYLGFTTQKIQELTSQDGDITTLYKRIYQGCTVPGFEGMESILAPQSLVVIFSLFAFFALEISLNHPGQSLSGLVWIAVAALIIQLAFIHTNGCLSGEYYWNNSIVVPIFFSVLIGGSVGVAGWWANHFLFPTPPGSAAAGGSGGDLLRSVLPPVGGPTGGSSGGSDDNQFVCEAYKNGELITSTIAE